ncbi:MAG: Omp28-related outer membrane protein [Flavobacteriales bacterium]|nr:Omp28-related outer membrane protein [Flavobacteriales bacterium]
MNSFQKISLVTSIAILFIGCDIVDHPVIEFGAYRTDLYGPAPTFVPAASVTKRVLLEDFTGHDCGNCPIGHQIAHDILVADSEHVAVVAVHAGSLAAPLPPEFPNDWTTPEGEYYLLTQVGVDEMPKGRTNRDPSANVAFSPTVWVNKVNTALSVASPVDLQMEVEYVEENNHLNVHVFNQWFQSATGNYRLVILVTESHIVAPQLWYNHDPEFVEEYEHEHMLRSSLSGATGLTIAENPAAGSSSTYSTTYNWNAEWIPENCEIVAFITDGENGQVLNVAKSKVIN